MPDEMLSLLERMHARERALGRQARDSPRSGVGTPGDAGTSGRSRVSLSPTRRAGRVREKSSRPTPQLTEEPVVLNERPILETISETVKAARTAHEADMPELRDRLLDHVDVLFEPVAEEWERQRIREQALRCWQ